MENGKILVQLDTDVVPSLYDRIVAIDGGADHVLSFGGVRLEQVPNLLRAAIWSRVGSDIANTAILVGGTDLGAGEVILAELRKHSQPQLGEQPSIMINSDGANTSAVAIVMAVRKYLDLATTTALILGSSSAIGQRTARLLARAGADVRLGSRSRERADFIASNLRAQVPGAKVKAVATVSTSDAPEALDGVHLIVAAATSGSVVLPKKLRTGVATIKVAVDLSPFPPAGIEGVELTDDGTERDGLICFGAKSIAGNRRAIQKKTVSHLFRRAGQVLNLEQIWELANAE
jgi:hypothetical protein